MQEEILIWTGFALLCIMVGLKKLKPLSAPNRDSLALVLSRFASATSIFFEFCLCFLIAENDNFGFTVKTHKRNSLHWSMIAK